MLQNDGVRGDPTAGAPVGKPPPVAETGEGRQRIGSVEIQGPHPVPASVTLPFTSRAKRVLELALESASSSGTLDVGPEHLLMGLCAEGRNIAAQVLVENGVSVERVRLALQAMRAAEH
jgi:ATP-dependent Clp protease ATP-binding subunit ClpA